MKVGVDQIHVPGPMRAYYGHVRIYFWYRPTIDPKIRPALRWYRRAKYENSSGSLFRNSIENLPADEGTTARHNGRRAEDRRVGIGPGSDQGDDRGDGR